MKEENLIFIISLPRSGSTYLQNLLSNNDVVNTCSEPWILLNFINILKPSLVEATFDNELAIDAFKEYKNNFPEIDFEESNKQFLLSLYSPLIKNYDFIIDKTPRYWEIINEIRAFFPESKMIILKRNPLEVAKSIFKTWNASTSEKMLPYYRDLILGPVTISQFEESYSNNKNTYFVNYESLIENQDVQIKELYRWLGIPFNKINLNTQNNNKFKGKYGDPFQNSAEGYHNAKKIAEQKKLNKVQIRFLKGYAQFLGKDFLQKYGDYNLETIFFKRTISFSHYLHMKDHNFKNFHFSKRLFFVIKEKIYRILEGF
ncbi:sulfotransferase [Zunongwangia sp. H14]|uniref:sulfotransferase family protein n=1 Tax=Zunongwangia sp. H14 TaxID=3240792 RepID=UPI003567F891